MAGEAAKSLERLNAIPKKWMKWAAGFFALAFSVSLWQFAQTPSANGTSKQTVLQPAQPTISQQDVLSLANLTEAKTYSALQAALGNGLKGDGKGHAQGPVEGGYLIRVAYDAASGEVASCTLHSVWEEDGGGIDAFGGFVASFFAGEAAQLSVSEAVEAVQKAYPGLSRITVDIDEGAYLKAAISIKGESGEKQLFINKKTGAIAEEGSINASAITACITLALPEKAN